jgi:hypothetical protein
MIGKGELNKVRIIAYSKPDYSDNSKVPGGDFTALVNPESYTLEYKIEYNDKQGQGTSNTQQKYKFSKPEELAFEFLFDASGVIKRAPSITSDKDDIVNDLQKFKEIVTGYNGSSHQPNYLKLFWGTLLFKGRLTSLIIQFKLFRPDGRPIRALAKAVFAGSVEENFRVALENAQSADLLHIRRVKAGDTLPMLCFEIYGDPAYYVQVAMANRLSHFRDLEPGKELIFPALNKTED